MMWSELLLAFVLLDSIQTAAFQFVGHGHLCQLANPACEPGTSCVETSTKQYRCLCNDSHYWSKNRICVPLTRLTVTDVHVTKVTSTSIQLSWSNRTVDKLSAVYTVSYKSKSLRAYPGGIIITNLQPASNYSFEIHVIIQSELDYNGKRGPGVIISAQTVHETPRPVPESTNIVIPRGSELILTKTASITTASGLIEFKLKDSKSISLIIFLSVTVSLSLLLVTAIVINIILIYQRRKSKTRNIQNVYNTINGSHQETHQYFDTININQSHYDEVTELAIKHYSN